MENKSSDGSQPATDSRSDNGNSRSEKSSQTSNVDFRPGSEISQAGNERTETTNKDFQLDFRSRADKLEERLVDFAVRIVRLSTSLPRTPAGKHIAGQILRSGTSPAPNYGEARGAESRADFVHKLRIVLKELNETLIWLRIIERSLNVKAKLLADILQENRDLCRIFAASLKTARTRLK